MTAATLTGAHDPLLVVLSVTIAIVASYTALDLAARVQASVGWARGGWLVSAALAMGGGVWSMHFVAMLAFNLPLPMNYAPGLTILSLAIPVLMTGLGFALAEWGNGRALRLVLGGLLMGGGIAAMHYVGMAAMRVPAQLHYDRLLVVLSVLIAIGAATVALWMAFRNTRSFVKLGAALAMGFATSGMHYTAMAGAVWTPQAGTTMNGMHGHTSLEQVGLAVGIAAVTFLILFLGFVAALFDQRFAALAEREAIVALRESEGRLQALTDNLPAGMVFQIAMRHDGSGRRFVYVSGSCERLTGVAVEAAIANPAALYATIAPEDRPAFAAAEEAAIRDRTPFEFEARLIRLGDDEIRWCRLASAPRDAADGSLVWDGFLVDITEQKRAETVQRQSEAQLRDLLATLDLGAFMTRDLNGIIRFWSEGCTSLYGWTSAEAVGRNAHDLLQTNFPASLTEVQAALERDGKWVGDLRHLTRDGRELVVNAHKALRRNADGASAVVLEALTDVTAHRRAEVALHESEAQFRTLADAMPQMAWAARPDGFHDYYNARWYEFTGASLEQTAGEGWNGILHPEDQPAAWAKWQHSLATGEPYEIEYRLRRHDGVYRWTLGQALPLRDGTGTGQPGGPITRWFGTCTDINDQKQAAEVLARSRGELERLVEQRTAELLRAADERRRAEEAVRQSEKLAALGQLTGGVAHDFNNLLQVVTSGATLLKRPSLSEARKTQILDGLIQAGRGARELTGRLLAFARRQTLRPEVVDVEGRLIGMSALLRQTLGSRVRVETDIVPGLWSVHADPSQLEVAILNLAVNARDAMQEGGTIIIQARNAMLDATVERMGGEYVCIAVKDTGEGMPPHILSRVLEPFFTTKAPGKGTGLGLPQVHGFAKQSGGDLQIECEVGHGTTVFLHLPRTLAEVRATTGRTGLPEDRQPMALHGVGKTVLVVEDNPDVAAFACALLEEMGYATRRAGSAPEALAMMANGEQLDAVFSDVVMPGAINGVELATMLRSSHPSIAVVLATGYSERLAGGGAPEGVETLAKPYHPDELAAALQHALSQSKAVQEVAS